MAGRRLAPDERALWERVAESIRPLHPRRPPPPAAPPPAPAPAGVAPPPPAPPGAPARRTAPAGPQPVANSLDGGWDRRIARGQVAPDVTIDLHGHTLAAAHARLDGGLAQAIAQGLRVILLVTGKPRPGDRGATSGEGRRGAIRAAVGDWLAASPHARHIAAVRTAHPRHGGGGALYIILRRRTP